MRVCLRSEEDSECVYADCLFAKSEQVKSDRVSQYDFEFSISGIEERKEPHHIKLPT